MLDIYGETSVQAKLEGKYCNQWFGENNLTVTQIVVIDYCTKVKHISVKYVHVFTLEPDTCRRQLACVRHALLSNNLTAYEPVGSISEYTFSIMGNVTLMP